MTACQQWWRAGGGAGDPYNPWDTSNARNPSSWDVTGDTASVINPSGAGVASIPTLVEHSTGKWYAEILWLSTSEFGSTVRHEFGITKQTKPFAGDSAVSAEGAAYRRSGHIYKGGSSVLTVTPMTHGNVGGIAVDFDAGYVWFARNGVWVSGDPALGTSPAVTGLAAGSYSVAICVETPLELTGQMFGRTGFLNYPAPAGFAAWG